MNKRVGSLLTTAVLALTLSACGGGSGDGGSQPPQPPILQSVAGIWNGQLSVSGSIVNDVSCLITGSGQGACALYTPATTTVIGGLRTQITVASGNQLSGSGTAYASPGYVLPDGSSTVANFTVTAGTVSARNTIELTFSILGSSGVLTGAFDPIYDRDSSLVSVASAYTGFEINGQPATFVVEANGVLMGQTRSGCILTGQLDVIDPISNGYDVNVSLSGCPGINGDYDGLAVMADSVSTNDLLSIAIFNSATGLVSVPIRLDSPSGKYKLDTGIFTTCAIDEIGVQCWGGAPMSSIPRMVNPREVTTASQNATCALDNSGVTCWGSANIVIVPALQDPFAIDEHDETACALDVNGVVCWGNGAANLLPVPAVANPLAIALSYGGGSWACVLDDSGVQCWGDPTSGQLNVPALANPSQIAAGESHACALDDTGVVCWGGNANGQTNVPLLSNPVQVSAGLFFSCAVDDSGVVCWGGEGLPVCDSNNCGPGYDYGQTQVPPMIDPFLVSVGYTHVCALDRLGAVCWGRNSSAGEADDRGLLFSY